jgi:hypothetical protein
MVHIIVIIVKNLIMNRFNFNYYHNKMSNLELKAEKDLNTIMDFIINHSKYNTIKKCFLKGPEQGKGYMWTDKEWWGDGGKEAITIVSNKVLELGWDSNGYGFMMRLIENEIKKVPKTVFKEP